MGIYAWNMSGYNANGNICRRRQYWDQKLSNLHTNKKTVSSVVFLIFIYSFSHTLTLHPNHSVPHLLSSQHPPHLPFQKKQTSQGFEANMHNRLQKTRHNPSYHSHTILNMLNFLLFGCLNFLLLDIRTEGISLHSGIWGQTSKSVVGMLMSLTNTSSRNKVKKYSFYTHITLLFGMAGISCSLPRWLHWQ